MEFYITQESNLDGNKNKLVLDLANRLKDYFHDKNYGADIRHFYIGLICVKPEFETFFKVRKPQYRHTDKVDLLNGSSTKLVGVFSYDIKLSFHDVTKATEEEFKELLACAILSSLSNLEVLPKKLSDFDKEKFKADIRKFFR